MFRRTKLAPQSRYAVAPADECRRRWGRYPIRDAQVVVTTELHTFEATTIDESIGGLGLLTTEKTTLFADQRLKITYHEAEMEGVVTAVFAQEDGSCRFSIRWPSQFGRVDTSREHPFVAVNGIVVACQVISAEGATPTVIRLWNGDEFQYNFEKLIFRTKEARRNELYAMGDKAIVLAKVYGLEVRISSEVLVDRILDYEFAGSVI